MPTAQPASQPPVRQANLTYLRPQNLYKLNLPSNLFIKTSSLLLLPPNFLAPSFLQLFPLLLYILRTSPFSVLSVSQSLGCEILFYLFPVTIYNISLRRAPSPNITFLARAQKSCRIRRSSLRALLPFLIFLPIFLFRSPRSSFSRPPPNHLSHPLYTHPWNSPRVSNHFSTASLPFASHWLGESQRNISLFSPPSSFYGKSFVSRVLPVFPTCHWSPTLPNTLRVRS